MGEWSKSAFYGGVYTKTQKTENCISCDIKYTFKYRQFTAQLEKFRNFGETGWEKTKYFSKVYKRKLQSHISKKQEVYLPVLIAITLLALVFVSKTAFSKNIDPTNNLPVEDIYKVKLIGTNLENKTGKICSGENEEYQKNLAKSASAPAASDLKEDVEKIVKNTPMAAMIDPISEKDRTVAAFIVGIAMKESKFGVYSPKLAGRDCYNYWGFKGGGKTVAGGYSCFASPEQAVDAVGGKIEKMVAKGVRTPAQAISWKCGSSCAGHGAANVQKWISDVAINFYKINS
ncbi:MAG: hypothetical protein UX02_C0001G0322 [Candidatus Moranbacteria bacterium GW2011_GWC1_45_18]|nr:MAG: hypothetical protein UT79_C0002G0075 [Candidatus Moranbacteria bacterium GW2011_GWC2_40_12]KKT33774.1 MAG: hypothetical protein UW19_C0005G0020 [Candidatus Moranbacteria bacterium GW2011_GWF2_44_10]KKU00874.1 MAG: hypothetical protein UX02_C0001G0322 [Candidatus Moranbacteria bacterium GW2011_GWC1_45_18]OGI35103.1 MAG: hypothetical protein A2407_04735 [Candidatus Moranbacteria bacterium RIFOXYC1_FULL_44_8]OGI39194.1 MAG: hypothetical protein A2374_04620 [Candidatus Moranbacteria bacteri